MRRLQPTYIDPDIEVSQYVMMGFLELIALYFDSWSTKVLSVSVYSQVIHLCKLKSAHTVLAQYIQDIYAVYHVFCYFLFDVWVCPSHCTADELDFKMTEETFREVIHVNQHGLLVGQNETDLDGDGMMMMN